MSIGKDAWKKLQASAKRDSLNGYDLWPIDSVARGKDKELLITGVHRPSGENVLSVPIRENLIHTLAFFWFFISGNASDTQRAWVQDAEPDRSVWSIYTLLRDLQAQLDTITTVEAAGKWQANIIEECDCPGLRGQLAALPLEDFLTTLDATNLKVSPQTDVVRLWYAACSCLGKGIQKPVLMNLASDATGEVGMGKVLRPSPLTLVDMGNALKTLRARIKNTTRLKVSDTIRTEVVQPSRNWKALMKEPGVNHGEKTTLQQFDAVLSLTSEQAVRRAVNGLKVLMGSKIDRTYSSLFEYTKDGQGLLSVLTKFWSKKTALEQADIEDDLISWIGVIREEFGESDATKSKQDTLSRIGEAMKAWAVRCAADGKDLDWSSFIMSGSMELNSHDDDEHSELMSVLLSSGVDKAVVGSEAQEQTTRKMFIMAVTKCKTNERRAELAEGFEKVAGHVSESKKAAESFLKARVGQYGAVELPTGRVRVAQQDGRTVIRVAWMTSTEASLTDVRVFIEKVFGQAMALNDKHERHGWGLLRVPQSQLDKLLGEDPQRSFVSDDQKVELDVRSRNSAKGKYFMDANHWAAMALSEEVVRRRPIPEPEIQDDVKRRRVTDGAGCYQRGTGFLNRYDDRSREPDHVLLRYHKESSARQNRDPASFGKGAGKGRQGPSGWGKGRGTGAGAGRGKF